MTVLQPKQLYFGNDKDSNIYTVSNTVGSYSIIKNISICSTGVSSLVNVHILGSAGTPSNNNKILSNVAISSDQNVSYESSIVLEAGQKLYVGGNASAAFTTLVSGVEYSA